MHVSVRQIFIDFAANIHCYGDDANRKVSLLQHVKGMVVKLMLSDDKNCDRKGRKKCEEMVASSGSESDATEDTRFHLYTSIVDDYIGLAREKGRVSNQMFYSVSNFNSVSKFSVSKFSVLEFSDMNF